MHVDIELKRIERREAEEAKRKSIAEEKEARQRALMEHEARLLQVGAPALF